MTHPELLITIKRIGPAERNEYEATLSRADNKAEICINSFTFDPSLLIDMEPQWMLDKAVPRHIDDTVRGRCARYSRQAGRLFAGAGRPGHAEAGKLLLNPTLDSADRAAQLVADRRYLFVFDNFESVMDIARERGGGGE